ncbi:MAG: hypothetical protein ACIAQU_12900, partial [Phycisphaerales bacterium JB064]
TPWGGQFVQPGFTGQTGGAWFNGQTSGFGQTNGLTSGFGGAPVTTNGSTQTYGVQGFGSPISPVSPITGNTPVTTGGSQTFSSPTNPNLNPALNQIQPGFAPTGFGGFTGMNGFNGLPTQLVAGQFPGQPFGCTSTFVGNGYGQPIFQQPGLPTGYQGGQFGGQYGNQFSNQITGFNGPFWNGQNETRGASGTTINVSQRDAA